jgi:hypothetical protein
VNTLEGKPEWEARSWNELVQFLLELNYAFFICPGYVLSNERVSINDNIVRKWPWLILKYFLSTVIDELSKNIKNLMTDVHRATFELMAC